MRRVIVGAALVLGLLIPAGAWAATTPAKHPTYALGSAKKCRADYVKRTERHKVKGKEVRYVACVYVAPQSSIPTTTTTTVSGSTGASGSSPVTTTTQPPAPTVSYSSSVDPSFTQSPSNPLQVTFAYSADAVQTVNGVKTDLGATGQLPAGFINFTANGLLACSINVGGSVTGGNCLVTFSGFGTETVIVSYYSADNSTTETDYAVISEFPTTVSVGSVATTGTVDFENYWYTQLSVPVTVSGLTSSLATTGTVRLVNGDGTACGSLTYNASQGTATASCNVSIEDQSTATTFSPQVSFSGDSNYASANTTGTPVTVPAAQAPTPQNVTTTLDCPTVAGLSNTCSGWAAGVATETATVTAADGSTVNVGTVSFVDSNSVPICTANVSNGRASCTEAVGTAPPGLISVSYSGGSQELGDAVEDSYGTSADSGHAD